MHFKASSCLKHSRSLTPINYAGRTRIARSFAREERAMQASIPSPTRESQTPTEPTTSRVRTVTGNCFPHKCTCGCGHAMGLSPDGYQNHHLWWPLTAAAPLPQLLARVILRIQARFARPSHSPCASFW